MLRRKPVQREKHEQAAIVQLLRSIGASVYILGTRRPRGDYRGTCQTPGIPDVWFFLGVHAGWIEVKAGKNTLTIEQRAFGEYCHQTSTAHIAGGLDDVIAWLTDRSYLKPNQVPYYRQKGRTDGPEQKPVARRHARAATR